MSPVKLLALTSLFLSMPIMAADIAPRDLRCEYRVNPIGLDVTAPRLSWILTASDTKARGIVQSAYRILVASSRDTLAKEQGDLWDTGKVKSADSIQISYGGKPLTSGVRAYWKVQVWDGQGKESGWSEPAFWSMGLLNSSDWGGKWIGHDEQQLYKDPHSPFRYLEKAHWIWGAGDGPQNFETTFSLPNGSKPSQALVVMSACRSFELILNGDRVGASDTVQAPGIWNVGRYLKPGNNSVLVKANPGKNSRGMIGAVHIELQGGAQPIEVVTDENWRTAGAAAQDLGAFGMQPWGEVGFSEARTLPARFLRKDFQASPKVERATAYVSGLGLSEFYVNGTKVGDQVLSPNLTDYSKHVQYVTFDLTDLIKQGANTLGLILGNGRFWAPRSTVPLPTRNFGYPKALVQVDISYEGGQTVHIVSDESWKLTSDGPIRTNNEYDGESYDANAEMNGWATPGFDDSQWSAAEQVEAPAGKVVAQDAEPLRVMETIHPVKVSELRPGVFIFDMGQNMVGWCRLHVSGPKGATVELRHAETLQANGELYVENLRSARATDSYTLRGGGPETWEPRFTYHGFRFVEVTGYPATPTLQSLEGRVVHDSMERTDDFTSSNDMLNRIHHNVFWGVRSNYRSVPTDCPQRDERQGWLGDRSVVSRSESYLFDVAAFYTKWERDLADSQNEQGVIPDVSPNYWELYSDDVTWPSTFVQVPDMLYDQYADLRIIQQNYEPMKKWVEHMRTQLKDGILSNDRYADWCVPPEDPKLIHSKDPSRQTEGALLATSYFYLMNRHMARLARLTGKEPDAEQFDRTAEEIKAAFNRKYFHADQGFYGNNTQTANLLPLAFGMVPEADRKRVFDSVIADIEARSNGHVATGLVGVQWLMRTLSANGRADVALQIATQPTYPGWGYMISKGATTVWELWNGDTADPAMNSGNHVMQIGDLGLWMYEDLAGIRPDPEKPGFKHIIIHPRPVKELDHVKASHRSPYGLIKSEWSQTNGDFTLNVTIPPNTSAEIWVPAKSESDVKEGKSTVSKSDAVQFARMEEGWAVFDVQSGTYSFRAGATK